MDLVRCAQYCYCDGDTGLTSYIMVAAACPVNKPHPDNNNIIMIVRLNSTGEFKFRYTIIYFIIISVDR